MSSHGHHDREVIVSVIQNDLLRPLRLTAVNDSVEEISGNSNVHTRYLALAEISPIRVYNIEFLGVYLQYVVILLLKKTVVVLHAL